MNRIKSFIDTGGWRLSARAVFQVAPDGVRRKDNESLVVSPNAVLAGRSE
jgi:hypothetical protein